jgi:hypothetical protein
LRCSHGRSNLESPPRTSSYATSNDATKRTLFDLRVVYDTASDRLSISATLTEAVAKMLCDGLESRLLQKTLRGWDSNPQPRH